MSNRTPHVYPLTVTKVVPDGDGDWTVTFANGAWLTVHPDDIGREPKVGETLLVQLPMVVGIAGKVRG
jgi:hypothetical protein